MCLRTARSRSIAYVGFWPAGQWNGAMNVPNFNAMFSSLAG